MIALLEDGWNWLKIVLMAGFGISDVEPPGSLTGELVFPSSKFHLRLGP
jgi:hypothetical protein